MAKAMGRAPGTVNRWIHDDRFPFPVNGPWDSDQVADWALVTFTRGDSSERPEPPTEGERQSIRQQVKNLDPLRQMRFLKAQQETAMLTRKIAAFDDLFVDRAAAQEEIAAEIHRTKTALLAEMRSGTMALSSLGLLVDDPGVLERAVTVLQERMEDICNRFADGIKEAVDRN
ncbi:MAG TPA: hypothetical protein VMX97_10010 [Hyphomicrobiaceae bacterium]|nr:hypothetical protein [Hyphomicrobiaceae bacterium]